MLKSFGPQGFPPHGPATAGVQGMADFDARPGLKLLGVRGYAYGPTFGAWAQRLREQGRLVEASD